jgi:nucleoside-diphosphate kinase
MIEQTLIILKPDAVQRGLVESILDRFKKEGFSIKDLRSVKLNKEIMEKFYSHLKPKLNPELFDNISEWMCSERVFIGVFEREDAVAKAREICGDTDPSKAEEGTIRAMSADKLEERAALNLPTRNLIHASASREDAEREISIFRRFSR